jgi:hypothetical protein
MPPKCLFREPTVAYHFTLSTLATPGFRDIRSIFGASYPSGPVNRQDFLPQSQPRIAGIPDHFVLLFSLEAVTHSTSCFGRGYSAYFATSSLFLRGEAVGKTMVYLIKGKGKLEGNLCLSKIGIEI